MYIIRITLLFTKGDFLMNITTITAQVLGILAMAITIVSMQCRSTKKFFLMQTISGVLFTTSFLLLGAWGGTLMNIFGTIRTELFRREKFATSKWSLLFLFLLLAVCAVLMACVFNEKWYLLLIVTVAQLTGTCCMWTQNGKVIRIGQICCVSPLWITYNCLLPVPSIGGILTEIFNICSVCLALFRYRKTGFTK